jgi:fermentation-respiration switch protein FrsA (DUF1100 family)
MSLLVGALAILALLTVGLMLMESRMLYYPVRTLDASPAARGWPFEEVRLRTSDGVAIDGWFLPATSDADSARLTVLFLHGNAGNISHRLEKLAVLRELGVAVLIVDYRGYGRSEGTPTESGLYRDARAAYDHLVRDRGIEPRTIVLYGESLGSAVVAQLASEATVAGVVLEAAFTSIADVGQAMYPFLPVRWIVRQRYDTRSRHAERLRAAAGPRASLVVLGGNHNEAFLQDAPTYRSALAEFLSSVRRAARTTTTPAVAPPADRG